MMGHRDRQIGLMGLSSDFAVSANSKSNNIPSNRAAISVRNIRRSLYSPQHGVVPFVNGRVSLLQDVRYRASVTTSLLESLI